MSEPLLGAIEAGGTKVVCAVGSTWREVYESDKFVVATTTPDETIDQILDFFDGRCAGAALASVGVASFGPIDVATSRLSASTPKVAWRGVDWARALTVRYPETPVALDTDVNAAGLAEWRWGASQNREVSVYWTVGTGIGGALVVNGEPLHGLSHPEFGHMFIPRAPKDEFAGVCLAHGDCLEGLASGVAIERRWGAPGAALPSDHPAWDLEADYLASATANVIAVCSPQSIVFGGGVMANAGLLDRVRAATRARLAGYFTSREFNEGIDDLIVAPALGPHAGVVGAFALAEGALRR